MLKKLLLCVCLFGSLVADESALLERMLRHAKGHQEFQNLYFKPNEQEFVRLIKEGQSPKTLFICCSDSRMLPNLIVNSNPGDLFVIRTAGSFVPTYDTTIAWDGVAATIEYAVEVLDVKDIIVCAHSHCGAIKGLFQNLEGPKFTLLKKWLRFGQETKVAIELANEKSNEKECCVAAEELSALYQLNHLMTYPFIRKKVTDKALTLHAWYYTIETGTIKYYNAQDNTFTVLTL
jgi:carbonic anhydrase